LSKNATQQNTQKQFLKIRNMNPQAKNSLYFKVLMILAVHVVVIGGMLMQGCRDTAPAKDTTKTDSSTSGASDTSPAGGTATATPAPTSATPVADVPNNVNPQMSNAYNSTVTTAPAPQVQPQVQPVSTGSAANAMPSAKPGDITGTAGEYVIVKGDTLAAIAHKNSISLKVLAEANPGVNPKKLKVGQKLQIPAGTSAVAATASAGAASATAETAGAEGSLYTVKSGDNLLKIAKAHGTSYKKIMALNDLKTTSIHAGQKLKLPAPKGSEPASTAEPTKVSAATPVSTTTVAAN
jgi:peptidoglycan DL-endopeptidase LytF